jgi:hypothetical protein
MYTERFSLEFVSGVLIAAAERRRPGLGPWTPAAREMLREGFVSELDQIEQNFLEVFDDKAYFARLKSAVLEDCFPRYCAVAEKQSLLEARDYGVWRGGDLIARGVFALAGLLIGVVMVEVPFIPIYWKSFSLLTMLAAPFLPEAQIALFNRKHARALKRIVGDMHDAEQTHRLYESMTPAVHEAEREHAKDADPQAHTPETPDDHRRNGIRER